MKIIKTIINSIFISIFIVLIAGVLAFSMLVGENISIDGLHNFTGIDEITESESIENISDVTDAEEIFENESIVVATESFLDVVTGADSEADSEADMEAVIASGAYMEVADSASDVEVHFIDVGQADATLIKADGHYMLIDAGDNGKGTALQLYLKKQGVEKLDYLILTHTDADHIGGADVIISKFDIDNIFMSDFKKDNKTYEELISAIEYKYMEYSTPDVGAKFQLGNAAFTILAPNRNYDDPNNASIALLFKNGDNTFLFTGDAEAVAEADILKNGLSVDCDVYKVGHHGSKTSSSAEFLNVISPIYAVISCKEGNSYGHPHAETMNNLRMMGVQVFRTDEQGSIVAYSDGKEITWNCSPSESWQVGE